MKKSLRQLRRLLAIAMSLAVLVVCIPFGSAAIMSSAEETADKEYVIWDANPDRVAENMGESLVPTMEDLHSKIVTEDVRKGLVDDETVTRLKFTDRGNFNYSFVDSGIRNVTNSTFKKWLDSAKTFNALAPYMTYKADYKASHANTYLYGEVLQPWGIVGALGSTATANSNYPYGYVTASYKLETTNWTSVEQAITPIGNTTTWYQAILGFRIWSNDYAPTASAPITIDAKNMRIVVKESQREEINAALAAAGSTLTFDELIAFDSESEYSKNEYTPPIVDTEYVIWDANPNRVAENMGESLVPTMEQLHKQIVVEDVRKGFVDGETVTRLKFTDRGNFNYSFVSSGIRNVTNATFKKWLDNAKTFNALAPYMTYKADYKASHANTYLYGEVLQPYGIVGALSGTAKADGNFPFGYAVGSYKLETTNWTSVEQPITTVGNMTWYDAILGFRIWSNDYAPSASAPITVDAKNMRIVVKESQRAEINAVLAAVGSTLTFDDLIAFDKESEYSINEYAVFGDVNADGDVDIRDLVRLKKHIAFNEAYEMNKDINSNGTIDGSDLVTLRKYLLGISIGSDDEPPVDVPDDEPPVDVPDDDEPTEDIEGPVAQYAKVVPNIDGEIDDVWNTTDAIYASYGADTEHANGYAKILWTENTLYLMAVVNDTTTNVGSDNTANQACFWVSETASFAQQYGGGDWNVSINQDGVYDYYSGINLGDIASYSSKITDSGYVVELAVPIQTESFNYSNNAKIAFAISIEDDVDGDNSRDFVCASQVADYWSNAARLNRITLVGK